MLGGARIPPRKPRGFMQGSLKSAAAMTASVLAAPVMLAISVTVFFLLLLIYAGFALRAVVRHEPSSLHAFFYGAWK